jgi:putative oxidoreductase
MIHFMKNISIAGGFLQVIALGAGPFTLNARLGRTAKSEKVSGA